MKTIPRTSHRTPGCCGSGRAQGIGLVELMVAMVLGALVVAAVVQIFSANKQTFRMQDAMSLTQEGGTYALDFIARDLLRAGFPGYPTATQAFDWTNIANDVVTDAGTHDTLAVVYAPQVAGETFCTGESVGAATLISNRYWVAQNAGGINELRCQGAVPNGGGGFDLTGTPQVLVDNVESFQVLYGVDLQHNPADPAAPGACAPSTAQPTAYIRASEMAAALARGAAPPPDCLAMSQLQVVRSVRIALLLRTPNDAGAVVPAGLTYTVLEQTVPQPVPADGRLRRLFTKTVALRNVEEIL